MAIPAAKPRRGTGRRKIPIQKIQDRDRLHVCFSKRHRGLFHMAAELSVICGAEVAVITFSPGGHPFSFGSPSVDAVLRRLLCPTQEPEWEADQKKYAIGAERSFSDFLADDICPSPSPAPSSAPSTSRFFWPVKESVEAEEAMVDMGSTFLDFLGKDICSTPSVAALSSTPLTSCFLPPVEESQEDEEDMAHMGSSFLGLLGDDPNSPSSSRYLNRIQEGEDTELMCVAEQSTFLDSIGDLGLVITKGLL